jgi:hypothetical protein
MLSEAILSMKKNIVGGRESEAPSGNPDTRLKPINAALGEWLCIDPQPVGRKK